MLLLAIGGVMALMQGAVAQYSGCPEQYGVQTYPHDQYCDKFYLCVNGKDTFSHFFLGGVSFCCIKNISDQRQAVKNLREEGEG